MPQKDSQDQNGTIAHGGVRAGAGRKPKALRYAAELASAEEKIIAALPGVIDGLIKAAQAGDTAAARYLLDRVFGRVKEQEAPPAEDTKLPLEEEDLALIHGERAAARNEKALLNAAWG